MSNRVKQLAAAMCGLLLAGALRAETVPLFDGSDSYVDLGAPDALQIPSNEPFTVEGWMLFNGTDTRDMLYCKNNARVGAPYTYMLGFADGKLAAFDSNWRGNFAVSRELGRWYHVAFSFDGSAMSFYLDGALLGTAAFSFVNTAAHTVKIGGYSSSADINGSMSDVRVWNYARSGGEILFDMDRRLTGFEPGLIGYWPLDEGEGTTVYDWTASGSDGTLTGAGWTSEEDLVLTPADAEYFPAAPVALADLVTGSERFTNSNEVDVAGFAVPFQYDAFQLGTTGEPSEIDAGGWLSTNALPARVTFAQPAGDTNLVRYVWFTNTAAAVRLRRAEAAIRYTRTPPLPRTADTYLREMDEAGVEAVLVPASFDWGSAGGESGGETIPLHAFALNLVDGPAADATPEAPFVTLRQTGDYQCGLVVMNAAGNVATSAVFTVGVVPWAGAKTEGDVVWSGGGGTPYWNVAANWQDGAAPSNPTPGTVTFANPGQDQMSVLEADRSVGKLLMGIASTNNCTHTLDLGGHTLRVTNLLQLVNSRQSMRNTLNFTNGTVQVGTDATAADWNVGALGTLCFMPSTILDARNLGVMQISFSAWGTVYMDLRGATVAGGALRVRRLLMNGGGWYSNQMFIDSATDMDALEIAELLEMGKSTTTTAKTPQYIGDPADPFAFDGATMGRLPAGISLRLGKSVTQRVNMIMMEQGYASGSINRTAICVAPGGGGVFTGYLSDLVISRRTGSNVIKIRALLDVAEMDSCELDILDLQIAPGRPNAVATDDEQGEMKLPQGTATVANATLGADGGVGFGRLTLSNTVVTVTNSLVLNKTGRITISTDNTSRGLTVEKGFTDADGTVTVHFLEQPVPGATNWALRIRGNVRNTLNSMIGTGRLVCNIAGGITGKRVGIVADDDYTYCALVDDTLAFDPVALVRNRTFEIAPSGGVVRIAPSEVDNGSFNPEDPQAPVQLRLVYNGGPQTNELVFTAAGSYAVTLVANIMENDTVIASASDSATITVVTPPSGTTNTVEWCGTAATVLMSDRPEWFWSGNWVGQEPPANPFPGTVFYRTLGQNVQGKLDADRRVAALSFGQDGYSVTHALDLAGKTLTIENQLLLAGNATTQLTFTNGTVQLGTAATTLNLTVQNNGVFKWSPGTTLDSCNINELKLASAAWAHIPVLDLRGATISGGALAVRKLLMPSTSWYGARLYIDAATALTTIRVNEALELGRGSLNENVPAYIGDPDDAFVWETKTFGRLPAGINLVVGDAPAMRAGMVLVEQTYGSNSSSAAIRAAPGGGGAFRAFLSSLQMALRGATGSVKTRALLDLSAMDYCEFDVLDLLIAPGRESAEPTDDERGELWLPPGTATVANAVIGAADGVGHGMLVLSNTTMSVTNRMTLNRTARVSVSVGAAAGGLLIEPADAAALTVAEGAQLTLRFAEAASVRPHYALRWTGDHAATVNGWLDAGTLVIDDEGLGRAAAVFVSGPATYVGLPPAGGTVLLLR